MCEINEVSSRRQGQWLGRTFKNYMTGSRQFFRKPSFRRYFDEILPDIREFSGLLSTEKICCARNRDALTAELALMRSRAKTEIAVISVA